jgi:hypothetical protein
MHKIRDTHLSVSCIFFISGKILLFQLFYTIHKNWHVVCLSCNVVGIL